MRHTKAALEWIVGIMHQENVSFEIDGGLAAEIYGAVRELADIDINVRAQDFDRIVPHVQEYLRFGPGWYRDAHWETYMITARFAGQNIDVGALDKTRYFDSLAQTWRDFPDDINRATMRECFGMLLPFIPESSLLSYKEQLGRGVDRKDVEGMGSAFMS